MSEDVRCHKCGTVNDAASGEGTKNARCEACGVPFEEALGEGGEVRAGGASAGER